MKEAASKANPKDTDEFFYMLYQKLYSELFWYAYKQIEIKTDTEDIMQDLWYDILKNIEDIMEKEDYRSWIYGCLKNKLKEYIREKIKEFTIFMSFEEFMKEEYAIIEDFSNEFIEYQSLNQIMENKKYYILYQRYVQGFTAVELAKMNHQTAEHCRMQISRLKKKVAEELKRLESDDK